MESYLISDSKATKVLPHSLSFHPTLPTRGPAFASQLREESLQMSLRRPCISEKMLLHRAGKMWSARCSSFFLLLTLGP